MSGGGDPLQLLLSIAAARETGTTPRDTAPRPPKGWDRLDEYSGPEQWGHVQGGPSQLCPQVAWALELEPGCPQQVWPQCPVVSSGAQAGRRVLWVGRCPAARAWIGQCSSHGAGAHGNDEIGLHPSTWVASVPAVASVQGSGAQVWVTVRPAAWEHTCLRASGWKLKTIAGVVCPGRSSPRTSLPVPRAPQAP